MALRNPTRADLVATVGELTGVEALRRLRDRLLSSPKGKEILKQRPRIDETTNSICRDKLKLLEPHTFGYRYEEFLSHHQFSPLERPLVRFIEDEELAYIMQVSILIVSICSVDGRFVLSVIVKCTTFGMSC
ncbi:ubiquinone biosynthesis COQ4 family protein [Galdieria sulphuraria]|uniref:Ubiquinone biosynthesis COQ4 family protein n=1 Tax=Galdieria sulphuraria TaxID=130081 RepID=M2WW01_GALSU|nr:ubiquinone biosynthesis COQ4 family protein [Galdieria sulphuraria]EME28175.1 ubiquinone biosynthesis COQ4 family protein [Galdieria sulphuraria]|eukprot:XP_005704695.1 ubiquinone biosynthesis COQ4 family protein [Galdieria sulphuraria]